MSPATRRDGPVAGPHDTGRNACLFARGRADLPDGWADARLGRLALALAAAGLAQDLAILLESHGHQIPDHIHQALRPDALCKSLADMQAKSVAQTLAHLRPIAQFGADAGISDAAGILSTTLARHPQAARLRAWLGCLWLARMGRHAEAVAAFRSVPDTARPDDQTVSAYLEALKHLGAPAEAEAYLLRFASRFDVSTLSLHNVVDCARALTGAGKPNQARMVLLALQAETYGTPPREVPRTIHTVVTRLLYEADSTAGRFTDALATLDRELLRQPNSVPLICNRLHTMYRIAGPDACVEAALPVLASAVNPTAILSTLSLLPLPRAGKARLYDSLSPDTTHGPMGPKLARVLMGLALKAGHEDEAIRHATQVQDSDCLARLLLRSDLAPSHRFGSTELPCSGFHIVPGAPGGTVVLVFLGGSGHMSYGLPVARLDRFFEERGATAIYCVDSKARLFLHGLPGIASDIVGVADHMRQLPTLRAASRVTTLGLSVGGFPALALGLALGCDASLVYGTKTVIARPAPNVPDPAVERFFNLTRTIPPAQSDLRQQWGDNRFLATELHFGAQMTLDRAHAERLADRPGVTLHPHTDVAIHDTFLPAIESGQFQQALDRLLEHQNSG
jgi:hypothetical protein